MSDRSLLSVERLIGVALLLMGFMNILLSLTGGYELDLTSTYIFLLGIVLFVHASMHTWHKWVIIGMTAVLAVFYSVRGVDVWTQRGLFYGTLLILVLFIFFTREPRHPNQEPDGD